MDRYWTWELDVPRFDKNSGDTKVYPPFGYFFVKHCFTFKFSISSWKGYSMRIQQAKESFMSRLARER